MASLFDNTGQQCDNNILFLDSISARLILVKAFFSLGCLTIKPKPHQEQTKYVQRHSLLKSKVIPSWTNGRSLYCFHTSKWVLCQNFPVQFLQMIPPVLNLSTQDTPNASDQISLVYFEFKGKGNEDLYNSL